MGRARRSGQDHGKNWRDYYDVCVSQVLPAGELTPDYTASVIW